MFIACLHIKSFPVSHLSRNCSVRCLKVSFKQLPSSLPSSSARIASAIAFFSHFFVFSKHATVLLQSATVRYSAYANTLVTVHLLNTTFCIFLKRAHDCTFRLGLATVRDSMTFAFNSQVLARQCEIVWIFIR